MNYLFVSLGAPPVIIHQEDRKDYYRALSAWNRETDISPLKQFLEEQQYKTWHNRIERSGNAL